MDPFIRDNLRFSLNGKKILLGVTGSIAAFKACDIIRFLRDCGAEVRVCLTHGAENFVTETTLETLSGAPVFKNFWGSSGAGTYHIDSARWGDLLLIAPATAHMIGKLAQGLADDFLSTEALAFLGPVLVAPAMNPAMYTHPAVQENVQKLRGRGTVILGPADGITSCGEVGLGRMLEPEEIVQAVARQFYGPSRHATALITLGPTQSALDPVRYLTNYSSGVMGASLAWAMAEAGYSITAVCGPVAVALPLGTKRIQVKTAQEMQAAVAQEWPQCQLFMSTAAVLDWDVKNPSSQKLKKGATETPKGGKPPLEFQENPDILAWVGEHKTKDQFALGFAAETENLIPHALEKMKKKQCDALFVNDVSQPGQGFQSPLNGGWLLNRGREEALEFKPCEKTELARKIRDTAFATVKKRFS